MCNQRFETVLSGNGQPGFTALDAFHDDHGDAVCVAGSMKENRARSPADARGRRAGDLVGPGKPKP